MPLLGRVPFLLRTVGSDIHSIFMYLTLITKSAIQTNKHWPKPTQKARLRWHATLFSCNKVHLVKLNWKRSIIFHAVLDIFLLREMSKKHLNSAHSKSCQLCADFLDTMCLVNQIFVLTFHYLSKFISTQHFSYLFSALVKYFQKAFVES